MTNTTNLPNPSTPLAFCLRLSQINSRYRGDLQFSEFQASAILNIIGQEHLYWLLFSYSSWTKTTTALLFFLRVTAVWQQSKIATHGAVHNHSRTQQNRTAAIVPLINDTAVFLAINYRILAHTVVVDSSIARLRVFLGGKEISTLSGALIQSGQHFYLVAVAANITLLASFRLSPVTHSTLTVPAFALVNAMACLVFRRIKFGLISSDGVSKIPMTGLSQNFQSTANPRSFSLHLHRTAQFPTDTSFPLETGPMHGTSSPNPLQIWHSYSYAFELDLRNEPNLAATHLVRCRLLSSFPFQQISAASARSKYSGTESVLTALPEQIAETNDFFTLSLGGISPGINASYAP
ncbi:hypothetical protein C8R45DRAFT_944500 [Mycena sanguinolenta]|nr:hypothetical protein C8R45DRAFT_944500 [Mycena sanguinolenta]